MAAALAGGSAAPSNFGRLLASSRFATHQPGLHQVYSASPAHRARGDFGLKRPIPTQHLPLGAIRYVEVTDMDSAHGGQTAWAEREREVLLRKRYHELNVRRQLHSSDTVSSHHPSELAEGTLGPRVSTTYDPSTRRPVPSHYNGVSEQGLRARLAAQAREGRGPVYPSELASGGVGSGSGSSLDPRGPFGKSSTAYSDALPIDVDYRTMDEQTFEKFLANIRHRRPEFRKHLAIQAALTARRNVAQQYEKIRQEALTTAQGSAGDGSAAPAPVREGQLPLPDVAASEKSSEANASPEESDGQVSIDLYDSSRRTTLGIVPDWRMWLAKQKSSWILDGANAELSTLPARNASGIRGPMHIGAGLQYGQPDWIQSQLLTDAVPARMVDHYNERSKSRQSRMLERARSNGFTIAVGGRLAKAEHRRAEMRGTLDWTQRNAERGTAYVRPLWAEAETTRDQMGRQFTQPLERPLPVGDPAQSMMHVRTVPSRADGADAGGGGGRSRLGKRIGDTERLWRARGQPGSPRWIGELEGRMGYAPGEGAFGALDYGSPVDMGAASGQLGSGSGMYSKRETRRAAQARQRPRPMTTSRNNLEQYSALLERARK